MSKAVKSNHQSERTDQKILFQIAHYYLEGHYDTMAQQIINLPPKVASVISTIIDPCLSRL